MTPNNASSQRKPAAGPRRRGQVDHTLIRPIPRSGPSISPTSAEIGARDRTPRHARPDLSVPQPVEHLDQIRPQRRPGRHQPPNPHSPKVASGPRGFLPWRLSDPGPRRGPLRLDRPASETLQWEQTFERYSEADVTADGRSPSAKLHERFICAGCRRLMGADLISKLTPALRRI
jgi:hypothetical protein